MSDELRDLGEALRARAVEIRQGGKHLRVEVNGQFVASLPVSPSDHRSLMNQRLALERAGVLPKVREQDGTKRGRRRQMPRVPYDGPLYPQGRQPRPKT